jgi:predicted nuclease with TOPRIM domain
MTLSQNDADARLKTAVKRRDAVADDVKRIEGRLEAARQALAEAEKECRDRNIDPDRIDEHLGRIQVRYDDLLNNLERDVTAAEAAVAPFLKEIRP